MASYYVPLPAARAPGPLNFEPINRGLDSLGATMKENRLLQQQKDIGNALSTGGYGAAADKAFSMGDLRTGLSLTQAEASEEDRDYQRQRQAVADQRAAAAASRAAAAENRAASAFDDKRRDALVNRISGVAQLIRNEADPARKAQMMQAFARNPRIKSQLDSVGFDPANPDTTLDMIIAEARGLTTPKGNEYTFTKYGVGNKATGELTPYPEGTVRATAGNFSKTPVYGTDAQGNTVLLQVNDQGVATQTQLPQGVNVSTGIDKIDVGDRFALYDKRSGQLIGYEPKNIAAAERQKVIGKAEGETEAGKPAVVARGTQMLSAIDSLLKDPYLPSMTGPVEGRQPNVSGAASRVQGRMNQLQGQLFLQAYQDLKGGGAISDFEAGKAEQSLARIGDPTLSDDDYRAALQELRDVIASGVQRAQSGSTAQTGQQPSTRLRYNPETGELE